MATVWTKETTETNEWQNDTGVAGEVLIDEGGVEILDEAGGNILGEGYLADWSEQSIEDNSWDPFGYLLYLATESGERLLSEGELEYLMYSTPGAWIEVNINTSTWIKETID